MRPLQISAETAQKLAKALDVPMEQVMHLPQHILIQKLVEIERNESRNNNEE
ncbi:YycC family protein [Sutcliffiella horikoshii]|uniref:YycC family protein n=1 Tax=Sutcliffiella horikoshii TaxID=79883 RepID=UPI0038504936